MIQNEYNIVNKLWARLTDRQKKEFNEYYKLFQQEIEIIIKCNQGKDIKDYADIIVHNLTWLTVTR